MVRPPSQETAPILLRAVYYDYERPRCHAPRGRENFEAFSVRASHALETSGAEHKRTMSEQNTLPIHRQHMTYPLHTYVYGIVNRLSSGF